MKSSIICRLVGIIIFLLFTNILFAQNPIILKKGQDLTTIADKMQILIDSSGKMTIEDIRKEENQKKFFPNFAGYLLYSPPLNCMWLKFSIKNETDKNLWGDLTNTFPQEFDFYVFNQEGKLINTIKSGYGRHKKDKPSFSSHYVLPLNTYSEILEQTFYLRIYNKYPIIYTPKLGSQEKILSSVRAYDYRTALYLGLMLVMVLYNSFIGYITKERVYLYYVLFLIYVAYIIPYQIGDLSIHNVWFNDIAPVIGLFGYLLPTLFAFKYLDMKRNAYKFYVVIAILTTLLVSVSLLYWIGLFTYADYLNGIAWLSLLYNPILWAVGVYLWFKGNKNARFYTIAWTSVLGASLLFFMIKLNIFPYGEYTTYIAYLSFSAQVVLFSIALGDRMNILQKEKNEAQKENLRLIEKQKNTLETKVKERTFELQEANEELQVMNEELYQSQEEITTQRDFLDEQNIQLNSQQKQIQSSIKAAHSIQSAILPYQKKLDKLLKEYFVINRPKDVVSGDFYWINKIENNIILVVADCTGHGVPGAFMTLIGSNLLDKIIRLRQVISPADILRTLHEEIQIVLRQKETQNNDGMDAIVLSIKEKDNRLEINFAGAKNEVWYFTPEDEEIHILKGVRKSIGGIQNEGKQFENQVINLPLGSLLYTGSDGLEDQSNYKRKKFGKKRLKDITIRNHYASMPEQKEKLEQALIEYMQNTEQRDDILWLGMKL